MPFTIRPCCRSTVQCLVTAFPVEMRVIVLGFIILCVLWWSDGPEEVAFWMLIVSLLNLGVSVMAPISENKKLECTPMTGRRWESRLEPCPIVIALVCLSAGWYLLKWGKCIPFTVEAQSSGTTDYLSKILESNQVDLLTIVIALAAYTSAVIFNLREAKNKSTRLEEELNIVVLERLAEQSGDSNNTRFLDEIRTIKQQQDETVRKANDRTRKIQSRINWIMVGDVVLVVLSILLIFRILLWSLGRRLVIVDELILAGLFGVVLYLFTQHAYQWKLAAWKVSD